MIELQTKRGLRAELFESGTLQIMNANRTALKTIEMGISDLAPWVAKQFEVLRLRLETKIDAVPDTLSRSWLQRQTTLPTSNAHAKARARPDSLAPQIDETIKRLQSLIAPPLMCHATRRHDVQGALTSLQSFMRCVKLDAPHINADLSKVVRMVETADAVILDSEDGVHAHLRAQHCSDVGKTCDLETPFGRMTLWCREVDTAEASLEIHGFCSRFDAIITQHLDIEGTQVKLAAFLSKTILDDASIQTHPVVSFKTISRHSGR